MKPHYNRRGMLCICSFDFFLNWIQQNYISMNIFITGIPKGNQTIRRRDSKNSCCQDGIRTAKTFRMVSYQRYQKTYGRSKIVTQSQYCFWPGNIVFCTYCQVILLSSSKRMVVTKACICLYMSFYPCRQCTWRNQNFVIFCKSFRFSLYIIFTNYGGKIRISFVLPFVPKHFDEKLSKIKED